MIGKVVSAVLLTILAASGRGVDGTTAVSHTSGAQIELLSGVAHATGMDPGVSTQARIAFVDGHDVAGPPSVTNVLTTWKRTTIPVPSSLTVEMRSNGFKLVYGRPLDPADGITPMTTRLMYRIYRNTTNSTSGAKIVRDRNMSLGDDIAASDWDTDATRAAAFWFGVQAYDGFGNASTVLWAKDDIPAPHPYHAAVTIFPDVSTVQVRYDSSADTSGLPLDPGWGGDLALYRATNTSGAGATLVKQFTKGSTEYAPPLDQAYYYQVASLDFAGNPSVLINSDLYWRIAIPDVLSQTGLRNGSFQVPDTAARTVSDATLSNAIGVYRNLDSATAAFTQMDRGRIVKFTGSSTGTVYYSVIYQVDSVTGARIWPEFAAADAGTNKTVSIEPNPSFWRFGDSPFRPPASGALFQNVKNGGYEATGGISGNRVIRLRAAGSTTLGVPIWSAQAIPFNSSRTTVTVKWWMKAPTGTPLSACRAYLNLNSDDFGQTVVSSTELLGLATGAAADGNWHEYTSTLAIATMLGGYTAARSAVVAIYIESAIPAGADRDIYIDDVTFTLT